MHIIFFVFLHKAQNIKKSTVYKTKRKQNLIRNNILLLFTIKHTNKYN